MNEVATLRKIKFESRQIKSLLRGSRNLSWNKTLNRKLTNPWPWKKGSHHPLLMCFEVQTIWTLGLTLTLTLTLTKIDPSKTWSKLIPHPHRWLRTDRPDSPTSLQSRHFACARISGCRHRDVDIGMWMSKWLHAYANLRVHANFWVFVPELSPRIHYFFALLWGYLLIILSWMNELTQNK